jgi:hypothetical protein
MEEGKKSLNGNYAKLHKMLLLFLRLLYTIILKYCPPK